MDVAILVAAWVFFMLSFPGVWLWTFIFGAAILLAYGWIRTHV